MNGARCWPYWRGRGRPPRRRVGRIMQLSLAAIAAPDLTLWTFLNKLPYRKKKV